MNIAVFDLETNGMAGASALSASSIVFDTAGNILDIFNRFYFPAERPNPYAERVHGLTLGRLAALREHITSTPYFLDDWPDLIEFWERRDVEGVVVHNLSFDAAFLPEIAQSTMLWWCSMRGLTEYCAIPKRRTIHARGLFKWPKLGEAADVVCNGPRALTPPTVTESIENAIGEEFPHVSLFDCFELYRVVCRIAAHHKDLLEFKRFATTFVHPPTPTRRRNIAPRVKDQFVTGVIAYERKLRGLIS
jgi:DNA polymerase III epsilon subunit-like protein